MYEDFFGLKTLPFKITPDPSFIYWDAAHKRAASILAFGIEQLVPITVVTGEVGTGKTTLLRHFIDEAPRETTVGMLSNFWSGMGGLYQWILNAFDLHAEGTPVQLYRVFEDFVISEYAAGRRCVLIVDEAQNVSDEDLEQLRMLTNINAHKDCLLMLFLVGQPELRDRLQQPNNRQIAQRVGAAFHLGPMTHEATGHYIRHRIAVAGGTKEIFEDSAIERIFEASKGIPRLVNVICELALVTAFGDGIPRIDGAYMDDFLAEAGETGLIAHLPFSPGKPTGRSTPQPAKPVQPGGSGGAQIRSSAGMGQRKPSIRLVSDPWEVDAPDLADPASSPAARSTEIEDAEQEQADTARSEEEALLSPEPLELEEVDKPEPSAAKPDEDTNPDAPFSGALDATVTTADTEAGKPEGPESDPADHSVDQTSGKRVSRFLSGGFNIALIGLGIAAVFVVATRMGDDTEIVSTEVTTPQPETTESAPQQTDTDDAVVIETAEQETPQPEASQPEQPTAIAGAQTETTEREQDQLVTPLDDPDGMALLEGALSSGLADPVGSAIAYSRAALRGQDRAAYYLGQLFETGVGVPLDLAASRAWYEQAQTTVRSARRRLSDLGETDLARPLSPPIPLLGGPLPDGSTEFVWSAGKGGGAPEFYVIETADTPQDIPHQIGPVRLTALSDINPETARIWRVVAIRPENGEFAVSGWRGMGAQGTMIADQPNPAISPRIVLQGDDQGKADVLRAALDGVEVTVQPAVDGSASEGQWLVHYAYEADRSLAETVVSILGSGAEPVKISAGSTIDDLVLPGQVFVQHD